MYYNDSVIATIKEFITNNISQFDDGNIVEFKDGNIVFYLSVSPTLVVGDKTVHVNDIKYYIGLFKA